MSASPSSIPPFGRRHPDGVRPASSLPSGETSQADDSSSHEAGRLFILDTDGGVSERLTRGDGTVRGLDGMQPSPQTAYADWSRAEKRRAFPVGSADATVGEADDLPARFLRDLDADIARRRAERDTAPVGPGIAPMVPRYVEGETPSIAATMGFIALALVCAVCFALFLFASLRSVF